MTTLKVLFQVIKGFIVALLALSIICWIIVKLYFKDPPILTKEIDNNHYFKEQITGFATSSAVREIKVYRKVDWWPDQNIANIAMYVYEKENIELKLHNQQLQLWINNDLKLDTTVHRENLLKMSVHQWAEMIDMKK